MALAALALAGRSPESTSDNGSAAQEVTLNIPVEIYTGMNEESSRAAQQGDPGNDAGFKSPKYLYLYAYITEGESGASHELIVRKITFRNDNETLAADSNDGLTTEEKASTAWTLKDEGTSSERWQKNVQVKFSLSKGTTFYNGDLGKSRVFAIASNKEDVKISEDAITTIKETTGTMSTLTGQTIDFKVFTPVDLRNIYSTPVNDQSSPAASSDNGLVVGADGTLTCSTVKLYHVAAKVDFTWEVAQDKRSTTQVASITCLNMPGKCKIFEPTANTSEASTNVNTVVLGSKLTSSSTADQNNVCWSDGNWTSTASWNASIPAYEVNVGNQWIGRAYTYVLQPSNGKIEYEVTYNGSAKKEKTSASFTPTTLNKKFTGWYRIIADVK